MKRRLSNWQYSVKRCELLGDVYSDILRCFLIRFFGAAAEHENNWRSHLPPEERQPHLPIMVILVPGFPIIIAVLYLRWPILEWVEIQSSYMYVGERAVRLIIMFVPSLYIKRSLIRVRTGKDPVYWVCSLLVFTTSPMSSVSRKNCIALLNPSKSECVCVTVQS